MEINIIDVNYSPLGHKNGTAFIQTKEFLRKKCVKSFSKIVKEEVSVSNVESFAYCCPVSMQSEFLTSYLMLTMSKRTVFICNNLTDIAKTSSVAVNCLRKWQPLVESIYVTSISTTYRFNHYAQFLQDIYVYESRRVKFQEDAQHKIANLRIDLIPQSVKDYAVSLRQLPDPVCFADIHDATRISMSSLYRLTSERYTWDKESYVHGRHITQGEREHVVELLQKSYDGYMQYVDIYYDM